MEQTTLSSPKKLADYSHNELVKFLAEHHGHDLAWREFLLRFGKYIAAIIVKECRRLHFQEGLRQRDDLFQDVFVRLREKDCKALRNFQARNEQSIIKYLRIITTRIVLNHLHHTLAQQRKPEGGISSIDKVFLSGEGDKKSAMKDLLGSDATQKQLESDALAEEIENCLDRILKRVREASRNTSIFRYYLYGGFQPHEITDFREFQGLSLKRIANIISDLKDGVRKCLLKKGIDGN